MLEKIFHLKENKTNISTELIAGVTTFMAVSYIIFINPSILSLNSFPCPAGKETAIGSFGFSKLYI